VESTGLKIKAVEALKSQRIIFATKDGFSGIESDFDHHAYGSVYALIEHLLKILNQDSKSRLSSLKDLQTSTESIFKRYRDTYNRNFKTLIQSIRKPDALLSLSWEADLTGWIKTLVIIRAALPDLSSQFKIFIEDLPHDLQYQSRINQIQNLSKAIPNHQIFFTKDIKHSKGEFSFTIQVNPSGMLSIGENATLKQKQDPYLLSKDQLTGFSVNYDGQVNSWIPYCSYRNNYWGKNCALIVLLDGVPHDRGSLIISNYLTYLIEKCLKVNIEFIVSEYSLTFYQLAGFRVSSIADFLSRPRNDAFLCFVDLGEDVSLNARSYIIYTLNRSFYVVDSVWKREHIISLRYKNSAVFLEYGFLRCFSTALKLSICDEVFQSLNTYFEPNPLLSSPLRKPRSPKVHL